MWKTLTRKQQELYKKALKAKGRPSANFVKESRASDDTPRKMHSTVTSAFDSVDQLKKTQDKVGEEANNIWKPKPRSISVKRAHKHYESVYDPQIRSGSKIPEDKVLSNELPPKRDFSVISNKEKMVEHFKIPKKLRIAPPKSLVDYLKESSSKYHKVLLNVWNTVIMSIHMSTLIILQNGHLNQY